MVDSHFEETKEKRSRKTLTVAIVTVLVLMSFTLFFSGGYAASSSTGTFIWGTPVSTPVTDLNPLTALNLAGEATAIMYPTGLLYSTSNGTLLPWLANNYTVSPNGTMYTFNLVKNATWMNGTQVAGPITAQDVVFTFDVLKANSTLDVNGVDSYIVSVTAINNYEVRFVTNSPSQMMLTYIGIQTIIPYSWNSLYSNISDIGSYTNMNIGHQLQAGPFILTSVSESAMDFVANAHFWKGTPHIQNLIIEPFKSTSDMTLSLKSGSIDAEYPAISDYNALKTTSNMVNYIYKMPWAFYLWDNTRVAPFNNTYFRQGLAYAINKTQIMQKAEDGIGGQGSFGGEPWTNYSWWASGLPEYHYNTSQATASFEKAGLTLGSSGFWTYPNGTIVKLTIVEPPISDWMTAASFITNDLSLIGFSVTESVVPFGPWATDMFESNVSLATPDLSYFGATPSFSNPWYVLWDLFDPSSFWDGFITHWSNATVSSLLNQSFTEVSNKAAFMSDLFQVQKIVAVQVPMVLIGDIGNYYAFNDQKIAGFDQNHSPVGMINLLKIYAPGAPPTTTSPFPAYLYYVIAVIVLVIIVVPVYLLYKRSKQQKEGAPKKEEETPPPPGT
ncbi:MAG: ABC transporter substrate-binding protein [Candidatus Thermoplasmatota archaeon]|jgi:peptide/nickel transport system substrate-binding protein|nr:ABC transporter substrate-binding protein [Candidatus Thermoplasmatota archaeon]MCL5680466.1 ABC transporter substrate-binding protein [Candidatus Thermoplasmatota archaeon]